MGRQKFRNERAECWSGAALVVVTRTGRVSRPLLCQIRQTLVKWRHYGVGQAGYNLRTTNGKRLGWMKSIGFREMGTFRVVVMFSWDLFAVVVVKLSLMP